MMEVLCKMLLFNSTNTYNSLKQTVCENFRVLCPLQLTQCTESTQP